MNIGARWSWLTSPLVATIAFLGVWGLDVFVKRDDWLRTTFFLLFITMLAVVATRLLSRRRTLPTLVGIAVAVVVMVPAFAVSDRGDSRLLPTPWALKDLVHSFGSGIDQAATSAPPVSPSSGLAALITVGVLVLFLAADYLAVAWRAAASAGVLLLGPWIPAVIFQHRVSTVALVAAIMLWLVVMALTHNLATSERRPAFSAAFLGTAVTLVVVLIATPLVLSGPGWGMIPRFEAPSTLDGPTRLNLAVDLRNSLTTRSSTPVIVYESSGARPDAFKLYTLSDFDGARWQREDTTLPSQRATGEVLWPTRVDNWADRERTRLEIQVLDLQEPNLPLPPTPRTIDIDGRWNYDSELDEVVGDNVTAQDARYAVETDPGLPLVGDLVAVAAGPNADDERLDSRYLDVARAIDIDRVESLAEQITAGETTRHGQAVALQSYLRNPAEFTYDTSVQPRGDDAISTFLDDREGYCIHFASTMVVMARTLDIPARMGHGFLPGSATSDGSYMVQGGDAHVWPEIWFPEQGWVRFEPTPAIQTGTPPAYADPLVVETPDPEEPEPEESPEPTPEPSESPEPTEEPVVPEEPDTPDEVAPPADVDEPSPAVPVWVWIGAAVMIIAIAVGLWLWWARVAAKRKRAPGPEAEWASLRARLPEHMRWGSQLTPYEVAESIRTHLQEAHERLSHAPSAAGGPASHNQAQAQLSLAQAMTAITAFAAMLAHYRYAPPGSPVDTETTNTEQLRYWADQVVAGAKAAPQVNT